MVEVSYADFAQLDIRIGQVTQAEPYPEARVPAIKLWVDFGGDLGLVGTQVLAVVNFPPRQIGKVMSEILVLGVPDEAGKVVLMRPDQNVPIGGRLF